MDRVEELTAKFNAVPEETRTECVKNALEAILLLTTERDAAVASKDSAYHERDMLVAALSKCFPSHLARHSDEDKDWEDDWRWIVYIELPTGQASWHIHNSELLLFKHLETRENNWDGHNTERKYERLTALQSLPSPDAAVAQLAVCRDTFKLCDEALQLDESDCAYAPAASEALDRIADALATPSPRAEAMLACVRALKPLAVIPIGGEVIEDRDLVLYQQMGNAITVGDVLDAKAALRALSASLAQLLATA